MRKSIFIIAIAAAQFIVPHKADAADSMPSFNITANCKAELAGGSDTGETLESCIKDETSAKADLAEKWGQYSKQDKGACIRETSIDGTPSYVELMICLGMSSEANSHRGNGK
jgi:hypothetical protein